MTTSLLDRIRRLPPDERDRILDGLPAAAVQALAIEADALTRTAGTPADYAARMEPSFRRRPHIDVLAEAIRRTVTEAVDGTGPGRLIVNMPPRVGKSTTSSLWTPAWFLERWPDRQVILATHTHNYAVSWGRKVRDTFRRAHASGKSQVVLDPSTTAAGEWETVLGGGMLSTGIGGAITGRGGHLLVIDDPIKGIAEAHSHGVREAHWNWWLGDASTRLEPGAAVIVLMTRWHEDDLVGRLLSDDTEGDPTEWTVIRLPAVGEGHIEGDKFPPDALGREEGVPLMQPQDPDQDPDRPDADEVARTRWDKERSQRGGYLWGALFQQRPSEPEGTILKRAWWQFYVRRGGDLWLPGLNGEEDRSIALGSLTIVQSWDLATKDKQTSDYVAGQVWGQAGRGPRFLLDAFHKRVDFVGTKDAMRAMRERWPQTTATWIEDAANGPAIIADLRDEMSGLLPWTPTGSKIQRVYACQGEVQSGSCWLPTPGTAGFDVGGFIDEAAQFPTGAHDDQVDAFTQYVLATRGSTSTLQAPKGTRDEAAAKPPKLAISKRTIQR